jgi:hypothetical protein
VAAIALPQALGADAPPISGPLRVHPENPRFLTDDLGRPIVLTGSHTWSIFQDLEHLGQKQRPRYGSYRNWLSRLERWNHSFTRGWTWEDGNYSPLPYRKIGDTWDLDQLDPHYARRLATRVERAQHAGIYTSILLFQGWSVNAKGTEASLRRFPDPWSTHPFSAGRNRNNIAADNDGDGRGLELHRAEGRILEYQRRYVAALVKAMSPFDNIIWEIANEAHSGSLDWQSDMVRYIRLLENKQEKSHLIWMSCLGGGAAENAALFSGPADIVSPCNNSDAPYLDNPPRSPTTKIVIADSDHIAPRQVNRYWAWKSLLRGLHPIYMDLAADGLPWYRGRDLRQDPRLAEQMRRVLGTIRTLAASLPLAKMAPQASDENLPVAHLGRSSPFALFSTTAPAASQPLFDGAELLALEPEGGAALEVCGLTHDSPYVARWLRLVDAGEVIRPDRFVAPPLAETSGAGKKDLCRRFRNPDRQAGKLLHLRRVERRPRGKSPPGTVQ